MMSLQGSKVMHQSGAEALITEEPDVLIGLVRICGGPGGQPLGLPGIGRQQSFPALGQAGRDTTGV